MSPGEEHAVCRLIARVFDEFVAPEYSPDGIAEFYHYASPQALSERSRTDHFVLVAEDAGALVGMIEMRHHTHVALLFVDQRGRGIARELFRQAKDRSLAAEPETKAITVYSSRYAVPVYERLGFRAAGPEKSVNGMTFVPMRFDVSAALGS
jgi:GNAT superfamily N-acetyltransferase